MDGTKKGTDEGEKIAKRGKGGFLSVYPLAAEGKKTGGREKKER